MSLSLSALHRALLLSALLGVSSACTSPASDPFASARAGIIGGRPSTNADFPSAGVILMRANFGMMTFATPICTGTLIAPDTVMTAGHCTVDLFGEGSGIDQEYFFSFDLDVSQFGQTTTDPPADAKPIAKMKAHPSFDINSVPETGLGQWFDVGIAFLGESVTNVTPEVVADAQDGALLLVDTTVEIAGYGQTTPSGMEIGIKNNATSVIHEIGAWEMQIGDLPPVPQKCHGDSGGPTYLIINDNRFPSQRVIGITSRAYDESDCNKGGIDSRADAYRSWFEGEMIAACGDGTRQPGQCANGGGLPLPSTEMPPVDAGIPDSGVPPDSGGNPVDGGPDAGGGPDASVVDSGGGGGGGGLGGGRRDNNSCGCSASEASSNANASWLLVALFAVFVVVRSRR